MREAHQIIVVGAHSVRPLGLFVNGRTMYAPTIVFSRIECDERILSARKYLNTNKSAPLPLLGCPFAEEPHKVPAHLML